MSLETEYAGLILKNPILVAAGPWSRNGGAIQRAIDAGAAAVVTQTITLEATPSPSPRLFLGPRPGQMFNTMLYSEMQLEQWEQDFEGLRRGTAGSSPASGAAPPRSWDTWRGRWSAWGPTPWR